MKIDIPIDWTFKEKKECSVLVGIYPGSREWDEISRTFNVNRCNIFRLERVENTHQWFKLTQTKARFLALEQERNELTAVAVAESDQPGAEAGLRLCPGACFALCYKEQCFYITNVQLDGNHP